MKLGYQEARETRGYMDSTLLKGLKILERVVAHDGASSLSEIAREVGLPKSNIHRTLNSLREAGYLLYNAGDRTYYPSLKIAEMGRRVSAQFPFKAAVKPHLEALSAQTGESAHFAICEGDSLVFLSSIVPDLPLASVMPEGLRLHWTDTAFGVAAVSTAPQGSFADIEDADLVASVAEATRLGYALKSDHDERHAFELAVGLRTNWGALLGVIGLTGPADRLTEKDLPRYVGAVQSAAAAAVDEMARLHSMIPEGEVGY